MAGNKLTCALEFPILYPLSFILNNQLRLHQEDADRLRKITGTYPSGITNVDDLNRFIDCQLVQFDNGTPEAKLLRLLLEDEKIL